MSPIIRIVRVKRTDGDEHILLHVTQTSKIRPLDLQLVATDHEHIYHGNLKATDIAKHKADQFSGSNDDLKDLLIYTFLRDRPDGASPELYQGLEVVARLQKDDIELSIRKNISGITQKVFSTTLAQDDEREEISPFDWVDISVAISDDLRAELYAVQQKTVSYQDKITQLEARLDEFIKAKRAHDDDMLQKFAALLNTKKRRIRDLRHRLEQSNVTMDDAMEDVEEAQDEAKPDVKRRGKKRAASQQEEAEEDISMNDAVAEDQDDTPQETDDEDDLDMQTSANNTQGNAEPSVQLPPPRNLPFAVKKDHRPSTRSQGPPDDEDATDDEL